MFSDKYSNKTPQLFQKDNIDKQLRIDLWNTIQKFYLNKVFAYKDSYHNVSDPYAPRMLRECFANSYITNLYENFFILPLNDIYDRPLYRLKEEIEKKYNILEWYRVYDLLEFISNKITDENFKKEVNLKLERNNSAYRFLNNEISPITNNLEIKEIEQAQKTNFESVNLHINKAIQLFSDKLYPDYENTIKESITAVETMCSIIVGQKTTLGDALKKLEDNGVTIHPSLKSSFSKLYGYTSDANGIRHSGDIGGNGSTFSEAKFMLISCSAFVNYLIENYIKTDSKY